MNCPKCKTEMKLYPRPRLHDGKVVMICWGCEYQKEIEEKHESSG
jgi:hypothetical protein